MFGEVGSGGCLCVYKQTLADSLYSSSESVYQAIDSRLTHASDEIYGSTKQFTVTVWSGRMFDFRVERQRYLQLARIDVGCMDSEWNDTGTCNRLGLMWGFWF